MLMFAIKKRMYHEISLTAEFPRVMFISLTEADNIEKLFMLQQMPY